jgi:hypothetical protein
MYISTKYGKRMGKETWSKEDFLELLCSKYIPMEDLYNRDDP